MIFDKEIIVPGDFAIAFLTGQSSLLNKISRPLNSKETEKVAQSMGIMLDQLQRQQTEINVIEEQLLELVEFIHQNAKELGILTNRLYEQCNKVLNNE